MIENYVVYRHTAPNGKVYIGISRNAIKRWNNGRGYKNNFHFYNAILKYGWDNIQHEILYTGLSKMEACEKEIALIAAHGSANPDFGYNNTCGGECYNHTPQAKRRMSEAHKGKGHNHTKESKKRISDAHKGKTFSVESRAKMSAAHKAMPLPKGFDRKGKEPWNKGLKGVENVGGNAPWARKVINLDTGEVFDCIKDAEKKYGVKVGEVCRGKRKKCGGCRWSYYEPMAGGDAE